MSDRVTIEVEGGVADVRMNRPEKMNALDGAMFAALVEAGDQVAADPGIRAVVLSGEGRSFCAGLDIGAFMGGAGADGAEPFAVLGGRGDGRIANVAQQVAYTWTECPVPVIAAVHGVAFGGGIQIALGADIRIVAPDAKLSVLEVRWGLLPDMTGLQMLPRLVGLDVAKELAFTGRRLSGTEAVELGLATRCADDPRAAALELAREIAGKNPQAIRGMKALLNAAGTRPLAESFLEETRLMTEIIGSPNQVEAVMAELEGRPPTFADPALTVTAPPLPPAFLRAVRAVVGTGQVLTDPGQRAGHEVDWTRRYRGDAGAVVRPGSTAEVAEVVQAARAEGVALVPQGGNTGLVGGAVPQAGAVVVDLRRLAGVFDLDESAGQLTAGAGTTIAQVHAAARDAGWAYGVDWAARDTATIGGSVATDAGGLRYVRHGGTRRQLLGIEAVLGTGAVVSHLRRVEKDTTGYDLAGLLCGSEGTLGLVGAVRVRLVAPRGPTATALVGFGSVGAAVDAAAALRRSGAGVDAVELILPAGIELVGRHVGASFPLGPLPAAVLLVEAEAPSHDAAAALGDAVASLAGVVSAAVATDEPRRADLWRWREAHTDAIARLGVAHKLDVSLPVDALAAFVEEVPELVSAIEPSATTWCFGHAADGNLHVNITGIDPATHASEDERIDDRVLGRVAELGGSIAGEHGIGRAKRRWLHLARSPAEVAAMRAIKQALDPDGICNPGVLLPEA